MKTLESEKIFEERVSETGDRLHPRAVSCSKCGSVFEVPSYMSDLMFWWQETVGDAIICPSCALEGGV